MSLVKKSYQHDDICAKGASESTPLSFAANYSAPTQPCSVPHGDVQRIEKSALWAIHQAHNRRPERSEGKYVQYGCGFSCPDSWDNFDASPRLRLQRLPLVGWAFRFGSFFPRNVHYGDIVQGLPVPDNAVDGVYASHVLEHLALEDCRAALRNTFRMLRPGGTLRVVLPDLENLVRLYLDRLIADDPMPSHWFMRTTGLGLERRATNLKAKFTASWGLSKHLWMWDGKSLREELKRVGFVQVRQCKFNDSLNWHFSQVEEEQRFVGCCAFQAEKPRPHS
jgi:SAM-dependent methyltransferase